MSFLVPLMLSVLAQAPSPPPLQHPPGLHYLPESTEPDWRPLEDMYDPDVQSQHYPSFGVDDQGIRYVVYAGRDPGCPYTICALFYQVSRDGREWSRAKRIPGSEDFGGGPQVVGARDGRAYIAWFGSGGMKVTWTDDQGASFAPPITSPPVTGFLEFQMEIDSWGALHFAWTSYYGYLYYLRSTPTYLPDASTRRPRDPVLLPGQRLYAEDGLVVLYPVLAVDGLGFVSIVYENIDDHIVLTRSYQGLAFPPSRDLGVTGFAPQVTASPDGPLTIFYSADNAYHSDFYLYSLVTFDGVNFEGPFRHTKRHGAFMPVRRTVRSGPDGAIYAIWYQNWPGIGGDLMSMVYAESIDYGMTFPRRDLVHDVRDYPPASDPTFALTPDGRRCVVTKELYYTESRW